MEATLDPNVSLPITADSAGLTKIPASRGISDDSSPQPEMKPTLLCLSQGIEIGW